MIPCVAAANCEYEAPSRGRLAGHLISAHGFDNDMAVARSKSAPVARIESAPLVLKAAEKNGRVGSPHVALVMDKGIEPRVAISDRAPRVRRDCALCARFAPEKCKHHGGSRHRGADAPAPAIRRMRARLAWIERELVALQAERDRITGDLVAIRDELTAL